MYTCTLRVDQVKVLSLYGRDPEMTEVEDRCRCEPEFAPNQHLILEILYETNKIWYFMIFSIIFTRTSKAENSLFSRNIVKFTIFGRYKNLTSTSLKKTWFYPACRVHNFLLSYRQTSFKNIRQESVWWWVCEVAGTINVGHVIYRPVVPSCFNNQITMNLLNPSVVPHLC